MNKRTVKFLGLASAILVLSIVFLVVFLKAHFYIVISDSMLPTIDKYSLVISLPQKNYEVGDSITYKFRSRDSDLITHRTINIKDFGDKKLYFTKGDNNEFQDAIPVSQDEVVGKVLFSVPLVGYILTPIIFGLLVYTPVGFAFGYTLYSCIPISKMS
jgi:signal peptidase